MQEIWDTIDIVIAGDALQQVLAALHGPGLELPEARATTPKRPGIYGIIGDDVAWAALKVDPGSPRSPLYVGRALSSLAGRDIHHHFSGPSGKSTLRRSLGALLTADLGLHARPRNSRRPGYFAMYTFDADGEQRLSEWMKHHLRIASWVAETAADVAALEVSVIKALDPPLNLTHVSNRLPRLIAARAAMSAEATAWTP